MPRSLSSTPDRDDVLTQEGDISVASTSDSGRSDDGGIRRSRQPVVVIPPPPVPTTCTMCDVAVSEFICAQCGRLSFCLKCSISLHDNKFLGGHKLTAVHGGVITGIGSAPQEAVAVGDLKILQQGREAPPVRHGPPPVPSSEIDVAPTVKYTKDAGRAPDEPSSQIGGGRELTEEQLVTLGSDRRLLRARLSEVARCAELLKGTAAKAAHEKAVASDATKTAIEAVRRRFDVLRQLVDSKEKEYFEVIDAAGKRRLDEATRTATASTVAATETEAFVKLMTTQLERLDGNNKQFFDCRRQMLDEVAQRTKTVDLQVSDLERSLEDIHSISLGVPVHLQAAIEAVQALQPPATLLMHYASTHHESIPADRFHAQPGVQVWAADGALLSKGDVDSLAASVPTPRKSLAQQVQELKALPMPSRTQSPARMAAARLSPPRQPAAASVAPQSPLASRAPVPNSPQQQARQDVKSSLMAKIAARGANSGNGNAAPGASIFPSELETLKRHIAQRSATRQTAPSGATTSAPPAAAPSTALQPSTVTARYKQPIAVPQPAVIPVTRTSSLGRASSPAGSRAQSPIARQPSLVTATANTPSKRAMSPTAAMRIRMGLGADVAAAQPGPGAYFQQKPFNSRSVLSTPPRRAGG